MAESAMIMLQPNSQRHRKAPDLFELAWISVQPFDRKNSSAYQDYGMAIVLAQSMNSNLFGRMNYRFEALRDNDQAEKLFGDVTRDHQSSLRRHARTRCPPRLLRAGPLKLGVRTARKAWPWGQDACNG
jgi:tRNA A37 N6-isopentenylltransferase MiaA